VSRTGKMIPFKFEFSKILELLAEQIYQSPFALLRENTQNAFDAICLRASEFGEFEPAIELTIDGKSVIVSDNGIGMTADELETHFWHAGKSGKNTDAARAAGVVGTFGIGALANFGIADMLSVETESARVRERTRSSVHRSDLSTEKASIAIDSIEPTGRPGTVVRAELADGNSLTARDARAYLGEFVEFLDIPVFLNGERLSGSPHRAALPSERHAWSESRENVSIAGVLTADLELYGMASGELRIVLDNIKSATKSAKPGGVVLLQGRNAIRTLRSGFGLATVGAQTQYGWGGIVDLPFLKPTAGREALDASSTQILQKILAAVDRLISPIAAAHAESFMNDSFLRWIVATNQFELCGPLEVAPRPTSTPEALSSVADRSGLRYYGGRDSSVIDAYASDDEPLVILSRRSPRRDCEHGYLRSRGVAEVDTSPRVTDPMSVAQYSFAHSALATRIARVLEEDYFLAADIRFGTISGGVPVLVSDRTHPVIIHFDPASTSVAPLLALYDDDFDAFGPFVKDFVRSTVFSRISSLVPSSTREGAEAFLRHLRSNREWFEYEFDDKGDLQEILEELRSGRLTWTEATRKLADSSRSVVEVSQAGSVSLESVVGGIDSGPEDEAIPDPFAPRPGVDRRNEGTDALILTSEPPGLHGYTCFLALSARVQRERGEFFLQPHSTNVTWGGRKVVFYFRHHSGRFGLYYDILCPSLVTETAGGGPRITSTILTSDRTFIPIPAEIADAFLPRMGEKKRLEVVCNVLYQGD